MMCADHQEVVQDMPGVSDAGLAVGGSEGTAGSDETR